MGKTGNQVAQVAALLRRYGLRELILKKLERDQRDKLDYQNWYEQNGKATEEVLRQQRNTEFEYRPKISIVVPTYETKERFLEDLLRSVVGQTYENWQLCIADGSESDCVEKYLRTHYEKESRITYKRLGENRGIAENTNRGLEMAEGEYIALLDHDDFLASNALYEVVKAKNEHSRAQAFYSDEDKVVDETREHLAPHFKPDLNWFLLRSNNYICHLFVVERAIARQVGGFRSDFDGAQDYDFILRCLELAQETVHIPKVLYHWRIHAGSTSVNTASKSYAYDAGKRAIEAHLQRQGLKGKVTMTKDLGFYETSYEMQKRPVIRELTMEEAYEQLTVGQLNRQDGVDYYLIRDGKIQMETATWKEDLVAVCQCPGVGMVGSRIYDLRGHLLHAAVTISETEKPVPVLAGLRRGFKGDFARAVTCQNVSMVGSECFVVSARVLRELGGISKEFHGMYATADLSLRMEEAGMAVVYQPKAVGRSKGVAKAVLGQEEKEQSAFIRKWRLDRKSVV